MSLHTNSNIFFDKKIIIRKEAKSLGLSRYFTGKPCKHSHISERKTSNGDCLSCAKLYIINNKESINKRARERAKEPLVRAKKNKQQRDNYRNNDALRVKKAEYSKKYYYTKQYQKYIIKRRSSPVFKKHKAEWSKIYFSNELTYQRQSALRKLRNNTTLGRIKLREGNLRYNQSLSGKAKKEAGTNKRRCTKTNATPLWVENNKIIFLYKKKISLNLKWNVNFNVDHIIPLISKYVCGLHCFDNLQLIDSQLNQSKGNRFQADW